MNPIKILRRDNATYQLLKDLKRDHKELRRHPEMFKRKQDEILKSFMESKVPNWGGIKLEIVKLKTK